MNIHFLQQDSRLARSPATSELSLNGLLTIRLVFETATHLFFILKFLTHFLGISINLLTLLFLTHICFAEARTHTRKFFQLSYYNPDTGNYALGPNDAWLVVYWVVVFTALRAAIMDYVLMPLSKKAGVKKVRDQARFCEQAWLLVYYLVFWTLGMVGRSRCHAMASAFLTISVYHGQF